MTTPENSKRWKSLKMNDQRWKEVLKIKMTFSDEFNVDNKHVDS